MINVVSAPVSAPVKRLWLRLMERVMDLAHQLSHVGYSTSPNGRAVRYIINNIARTTVLVRKKTRLYQTCSKEVSHVLSFG